MWFSDEQRRALAIGAIRTQCDEGSHEWPGGAPPTPQEARRAKQWLREEDVADRDDLVVEMRAQLESGTSLSLGHAVNLAGNAWLAGWLDDAALWPIVFEAQESAFRRFASWEAFARAHGEDCDPHEDEVRALLTESSSPWVRFSWGTKEPRAKVEPPMPRRHPAAPRSVVEAFGVALRGAWGVAEHASLGFLGGVALLPRTSGGQLRWFLEENRDRDVLHALVHGMIHHDGIAEQLAPLLARAAQYGRSAKVRAEVDADPAASVTIGMLRSDGVAAVTRMLRAWTFANASELVNRGFVAGILGAEEAWALLRDAARAAQKQAHSWEEQLDLTVRAMAFREGDAEVPRFCVATRGPLLERDDSPLRRVPWDANLEADEPLPPPATFLCVAVKLSLECEACRAYTHVDDFAAEIPCAACGRVHELSPNDWKLLLADPIDYGRKTRDGAWRNRMDHGAKFRSMTTWATRAPSCARCDTPLELARLSDRAFASCALSCPSCGSSARAEAPLGSLATVDPLLWATIVPEGDAPRREAGVLAVPCIACGGELHVDGTDRVPQCPHCGAHNGLSGDLWAQFHPARTRRTLFLVTEHTMPPVDLPTPSPDVATTTGLRFSSLSDDYNGLYGLNAYLDAPVLRPEPPLSRAQRFMLALGAVDRHVAGLDQARIAGVPRTIAYRVHAAVSLRKKWNIDGADAWRASFAKVSKARPFVERLRRQHHLLRLGYLAGWVEEQGVWDELMPLARKAREEFSSFAAFGEAHKKAAFVPTSDEVLRSAARELSRDPCSPWCCLDWDTALDDASPCTHDEPLDWVRVRVAVSCAECLSDVPVDDMVDVARCPKCRAEVDLSRDTWRERLEQVVFVARQLAPDTIERTSDHRYDGTWSIEVVREAPRCDGCQSALPVDGARGVVACATCGLGSAVRSPNAAETAIDPRLRLVLAREPNVAPTTRAVPCASCGASLEADGHARILPCAHCHARVWVTDRDWLHFHPVARRRGFYLALSRNRTKLGAVAMPDDENQARSFLVLGVPATLAGHERIA